MKTSLWCDETRDWRTEAEDAETFSGKKLATCSAGRPAWAYDDRRVNDGSTRQRRVVEQKSTRVVFVARFLGLLHDLLPLLVSTCFEVYRKL